MGSQLKYPWTKSKPFIPPPASCSPVREGGVPSQRELTAFPVRGITPCGNISKL